MKLTSKNIAYWAPVIVALMVHFEVLPGLLPPRHWIFIDLCCAVVWYESPYIAGLIDELIGKTASVAAPAVASQPAPVAKSKLDAALETAESELNAARATANAAAADVNAGTSKLKALAAKVA